MPSAVLDVLGPPYLQRAVAELLLLAALAGLLGTWIVLRRLAFYSHAVGTAAFPGLVVSGPLGIAPQLAALGTGLAVAGGVAGLGRARRIGVDAATGIVLAAALAAGVILASDVYESGSGVDRLLFGSLLTVSDRDLAITLSALLAVAAIDAACRRSWLLHAFDAEAAGASRLRIAMLERLQLAAIAAGAIVALDAVGALMVSAILVVPAATARLVTRTVRTLRLATTVIAAGEGVAALLLARAFDVAPGATLAVLSSVVFAIVSLLGASRR